jgi:hypothetical protein
LSSEAGAALWQAFREFGMASAYLYGLTAKKEQNEVSSVLN